MRRGLFGIRSVTWRPRVFVSYDRRDRVRMVDTLVGWLRARGVQVWVDHGEIRPGDSLVRKVFVDGIGTADVVVAVVSPASLDNPWCRAEWDAAVTRWIHGRCRLVVLRLDGATVPAPLDGLAWLDVDPGRDWLRRLRLILAELRTGRS